MLLDDYRKVGNSASAKWNSYGLLYFSDYVLDLYIFRNFKAHACHLNLYSDSWCFYSRLGINISKSGEESISSQSSIFSLGITSERGS